MNGVVAVQVFSSSESRTLDYPALSLTIIRLSQLPSIHTFFLFSVHKWR